MTPKVSIIIPVYNGSNYLKEAIDSALAQTYKNIEVVVINDGSTDNGKTARIARKYGQKIRYFEKPNGGVASALNYGLDKMTGQYFSWLSHDDVYLPDKTARQVAALKKYQKKNKKIILYGDFEIINPTGHLKAVIDTFHPASQFIYDLIDERFIHGCTVLAPRLAFKKIGSFNPKLKNVQDYEMWFRLMKHKYTFNHVGSVLIKSRLHPSQGINLRKLEQKAEEEFLYTWVLKNFPAAAIYSREPDKMFVYINLYVKFKKTNLPKTARYCFYLLLRNLEFSHIRRDFGFLSQILTTREQMDTRLK